MTKQVMQIATGKVARAVLITIGTLAGTLTASSQDRLVSEPSPAFLSALTAYDQAWNTSELAFAVATFTDGASQGYGNYTPRETSEYSGNDSISVYAEPVAYGFTETESGYQYELTASYKLLNTSGQVLAEQSNFAKFTGSGRAKQRELSASLTFQFSGLPAGDYQLETLFADETNGKQSGFTLPFTVSANN
ncbi:MAG: hypothetical protein ABJL55_14405 [Roseibium sp.]